MIEMRIELLPRMPGEADVTGLDEVKCKASMAGPTGDLLAEALVAFAYIAATIGCKEGRSDARNAKVSIAVLEGICQEARDIMPAVVQRVRREGAGHGLQ